VDGTIGLKVHKEGVEEVIPIGTKHYRAFVGPMETYDVIGAMQFNLLTSLGLRDFHYLLDIGCGSLRAGRLFIVYLRPHHYYCIEPEKWLVEEGIKNNIGKELIELKKPQFSYNKDFTCIIFNQKFDFILAHSIFSHASQKQIIRCLSEVEKCMKETSIFSATFVKGNSNYSGEKWVYPDTVTYTEQRMVELANNAGLDFKTINWYHPNRQTWALFTHPKNKMEITYLYDDESLLRSTKKRLDDCEKRLALLENRPHVILGRKILRTRFGRKIFQTLYS